MAAIRRILTKADALRDGFTVSAATGCHEWRRAKNVYGYGLAWFDGRLRMAHRLAAEIAGLPTAGKFVCHRCDNRGCVNAEHLFIGTQAENMLDAAEKGRMPRGERHPGVKVSDDEADQIRRLVQSGLSQRKAGRRFGLSHSGVQHILKHRKEDHGRVGE